VLQTHARAILHIYIRIHTLYKDIYILICIYSYVPAYLWNHLPNRARQSQAKHILCVYIYICICILHTYVNFRIYVCIHVYSYIHQITTHITAYMCIYLRLNILLKKVYSFMCMYSYVSVYTWEYRQHHILYAYIYMYI